MDHGINSDSCEEKEKEERKKKTLKGGQEDPSCTLWKGKRSKGIK